MRCYSKDSLKLSIKDEHKQNIKDVATKLKEEIQETNMKFSIDTLALLYAFLCECGVEGLIKDE